LARQGGGTSRLRKDRCFGLIRAGTNVRRRAGCAPPAA
jgi:hypothetical protein